MRQCRVDRTLYIPVNITTRGNGIQERLVDSLHGGFQVFLDDSVKLECLTSGDLERRITVFVCYPIDGEPLIWCADPTGQSTTDHECLSGFQALSLE